MSAQVQHSLGAQNDENENDESFEDSSGTISKSTVGQLRDQLGKLGLSTKGHRKDLQKRLRSARKRQAAQATGDPPVSVDTLAVAFEEKLKIRKKADKYLCVIDFEATCEATSAFDFDNEIIEFPAVLLNARTGEVMGEFQGYVKPSKNPILSDFCKSLTGISQTTIDNAEPFTAVLKRFETWLMQWAPHPFRQVQFVCDGPWDIRDFMRKQCIHSRISRPVYLRHFIDLRRSYIHFYKCERTNLAGMLQGLGMVFEGREHCGLHDTRNIARIAQRMISDGYAFETNYVVTKKKFRLSPTGKMPATTIIL
ncbi:ribonuclease H-like domain-containing protein [Phlyctochytrium arcticum]|nr:ribonuclease H-like domain-containing protein [Phlyctochytrium arcticum]